MDPNATLAHWRELIAEYERLDDEDSDERFDALDEANVAAGDLVAWLDRGGFAPKWAK